MRNPSDRDLVKEQDDPAVDSLTIKPKPCMDITVIFDRSGSMESMKHAVVEGFNSYVKEMRQTPGDTRWTLVQFDDPSSAAGAGEKFPDVLFENVGEKDVPFLSLPSQTYDPALGKVSVYNPRGNTALVDALYVTIGKTKERLDKYLVEDRPRGAIVIVTDGQENNSRKHTSDELRALIAECQVKRDWQFVYLGANQDSFVEAKKYGIGAGLNYMGVVSGTLANVGNYLPTAEGLVQAIDYGMRGMAACVSGSMTSGLISYPPELKEEPAVNPIVQIGNFVLGKIIP